LKGSAVRRPDVGNRQPEEKPTTFTTAARIICPMTRIVGRPKAKTKPKRPAGRPPRFTPELAAKICGLIATGSTLRAAAKACGVGWRTVARWNVEHPEFRAAYEQARETRTLVWAEECIDIVDDARGDYVENSKTGKPEFNRENVHRAKLRVDERHWQMARLDPRLWSDRSSVDVSANIMLLSPEERVQKALALFDLMEKFVARHKAPIGEDQPLVYDPGGDLPLLPVRIGDGGS